jgi:hypothetical protein
MDRTPLAIDDIAGELAVAYANATGRLPSAELLATMTGIVGLETAGGIKIWNWNFGNISASSGDVWKNPHSPDPRVPQYFAAYPNAATGAGAFVGLLLRAYAPVLLAGEQGDVELAVHELYRMGYVVALSPDEEAAYARGVRSYYRKAYPAALAMVPREVSHGAPTMGLALISSSLFAVGAMAVIARKLAA